MQSSQMRFLFFTSPNRRSIMPVPCCILHSDADVLCVVVVRVRVLENLDLSGNNVSKEALEVLRKHVVVNS